MKSHTNSPAPKGRLDFALGLAALVVFTLIALFFVYSVLSTQLLTTKLMAVLIVIVVLLVVCVWLLAWSPKRKKSRIVGLILAMVLSVVFAVGIVYVRAGLDTWENISSGQPETTAVAVYFRSDDESSLEDVVSSYTFGTLSKLDQDTTDAAVNQLNQEYGVTLNTAPQDSLIHLVNVFLEEKSVDAIILNTAYLQTLESLEGYEDIAQQLREAKVVYITEESPQVEPTPTPSTPVVDDNCITILINGSDARNLSLSVKGNSDVNILAVLNRKTHQVLLLATPRDYYIPIAIEGKPTDKLTHSGQEGVQVTMDTLENLYDIDIDYYFRVNFTGFVDIIDALGGITVNSDYNFTAYVTGERFYKGKNDLNGTEALAFARERHAFATGDFQRVKHQMEVIRAVAEKALSPQLLTNYMSILDAVEGSFETNVPYDLLSSLVREQLDSAPKWEIIRYNVTGSNSTEYCPAIGLYASVVIPYENTVETAKDLFDQIYDNQILTQPE